MARRPGLPSPARVQREPAPASGSRTSWLTALQGLWKWGFTRRYELAALVLWAFVLVARAPWVLLVGRFWAEEATVHLAYAWNHSVLDALTAPQFGYCNLVANIGALIAAHVPLESAPHFTTALALVVQLVPAALILFTSIPGLSTPLRKMSAVLLVMIAPANPEVYLNSINSQSILCAAAGIVLISEIGGRADRFCKWVVLGLAGLSGVATSFLAPLFWLQWWLERRKARLTQAVILSACALLQFVFISQGIAHNQRHLRFSAKALVGAAYAKFVITPLAPAQPINRHLALLQQNAEESGIMPAWVWFVTAAAFTAFLLLCWRSGNRAARMLALAAIWVTLLSFCGSRDTTSDLRLLDHISHALRYYYAPECYFLLALLASLAPDTSLPAGLKAVGALWVAAALLMGLANFACAPVDWPLMFSGPRWSTQVEQWRQDPSKPLAVWPIGWKFNLPPKAPTGPG
ncbi:MAG TPA: hypothetical protein VMU04_20910 [Candidatus Acidoferrum sp.]|nr:hypothetical protein [Candidatus Acidoferrum sp.]